MRLFSCNGADSNIKNSIETAKKKAKKIKLLFRVYPLETEEVIVCEMNPLHIVFFSYDGCVSPCVYLNMTKRGSIPRIFCGSYHEVQRLCFGNISENDFMEIWDNDDYKNFRGIYINRLYLLRKIYTDFEYGIKTVGKIKGVERLLKNVMANHPVPHVCRTCYKAYNL
jgi:MoaA/NifB/PqqE/SkfB family radical SAM enzyme